MCAAKNFKPSSDIILRATRFLECMTERRKDYLTASDYYRFLQCPHWPYYDRFATDAEKQVRREISDAERTRQENGVLHEHEVVQKLFEGTEIDEVPQTRDPEADCAVTLEWMKRGVPLIYQGTLTFGEWTGRPDLLERREGESALGNWYYVPVDVKSAHYLEKYHKVQLVFYATLLEKLQGRFPAEPAIINGDGVRLPFMAEEMIADFQSITEELERIRVGEKPDPVLRKSCFDTGVWGTLCKRDAEANNDIALLYNVDVQKLRMLRSLGVRTVADAAGMDPQALDGAAKGLRLHGLEVMKRQAQSLQTKEVVVREIVPVPTKGLEIHFDIESDPPNDVDYLYGLLIRKPEGDEYVSFVAERLEDEGILWKKFLAWLETLPPEYTVYHFASYEMTRLAVLEARYGGSQWLDLFRSSMVDLKELTTHAITFPLYFYGLKYIAKFLGFFWRSEVQGGGQSVDVFEKYLETRDRALLDSIILYNEDDVRATALLKDWLARYAQEVTSYDEPYPWVQR